MLKCRILEMLEHPTTTYDVATEIGMKVSTTGAYLSMLKKRGVIKVIGVLPGSKNNRPKNLWKA